MRKTIIRAGLILLLILLCVLLFVMGKQHKIYIDNREYISDALSLEPVEAYMVWVDGEEVGIVKTAKRKVAEVAGPFHQIEIQKVEGRDLVGEKISRKFNVKLSVPKVVINLPAMLNDVDDWIIDQMD